MQTNMHPDEDNNQEVIHLQTKVSTRTAQGQKEKSQDIVTVHVGLA